MGTAFDIRYRPALLLLPLIYCIYICILYCTALYWTSFFRNFDV
jgi:hypothetical protein